MIEEQVWVVKKVVAEEDYILRLFFADGKEKLFDFKPYLDEPIYESLRSPEVFDSVRAAGDSVVWDGGIDIAPEELYEKSIEV